MKESVAEFDSNVQLVAIDAILGSQEKQGFECHYVATDPTHIHLLASWRDDRKWLPVRTIIKGSVTRRLKKDCSERTWLVEGGSRKRVRDRAHFDYLVKQYLPRHRGWKWSEARGKFR